MINLDNALAAIVEAARAQFGPEIGDIESHPGEFTEDELRRFHVGRVAMRIALLDVTEVQVSGTGARAAMATIGLFVIATDRRDNKRNAAALATVSEALEWLSFNQFGDDRLMPADPKTISAQNLYSGDLDASTGVAFWGVRWQQRIKAAN